MPGLAFRVAVPRRPAGDDPAAAVRRPVSCSRAQPRTLAGACDACTGAPVSGRNLAGVGCTPERSHCKWHLSQPRLRTPTLTSRRSSSVAGSPAFVQHHLHPASAAGRHVIMPNLACGLQEGLVGAGEGACAYASQACC